MQPTRDVKKGYEESDARAMPILISGLVLAIFVGLGALIGGATLVGFRAVEAEERGPISPMFERQLPGAPALQANPYADLDAYRARQREAVQSYGWISERDGVVRIPVERAMELLVERSQRPQAEDAPEDQE